MSYFRQEKKSVDEILEELAAKTFAVAKTVTTTAATKKPQICCHSNLYRINKPQRRKSLVKKKNQTDSPRAISKNNVFSLLFFNVFLF